MYQFVDLRAPFVLRSEHMIRYVDGKSVKFAPLLDVQPAIQNEAFAAFIQQNVIDITELAYVFPIMDHFIRSIQADMDVWRNIRIARIDYTAAFITANGEPSDFTTHVVSLLGRCLRIERMELYVDHEAPDFHLGCLPNSLLVQTLSSLPRLEQVCVCWNVASITIFQAPFAYAVLLDKLNIFREYIETELRQRESCADVCMECDRLPTTMKCRRAR